MDDLIVVKGVTFKKCDEWTLYLKKGDLVTPIWNRKRCVRLLITRADTGGAIYVDSYSNNLYIPVSVSVYRLPQGVTYVLNEDCYLSVLTTMISFNPLKTKVVIYDPTKKQEWEE